MSNDWFLQLWIPLKVGEMKIYEAQKHKRGKILHFYSCLEAWKHVLENNIAAFTLHKAECVIDCSSGKGI